MSSKDLKNCIIRILKGDELSGYQIYKMLTLKGKETWPNHVYTLLVQMEKREGWLKSRWKYDGKKDTRVKKHLYSLSESGKSEYDNIVRDSLGVLMECFFKENLSFEDLSFHIGLAKETLGSPAKWPTDEAFRLVIASPTYHPLICFPKFYYALSEAYPKSDIYVVKNCWEKPLNGRKNLTFLDGSRVEIPLKDNFADYVLLQGFPKASSVSDTIGECLRVSKEDGCLFVEIPSMLAEEKRVSHVTIFPEYVLKLFYELCGQDRSVRMQEVERVLSTHFDRVRSVEVRSKLIFYAARKKNKPLLFARPSPVRNFGK